MPRFFVPAAQVGDGRVTLLGRDAEHLARALRARPGEVVAVVDDAGCEHAVALDLVTAARVEGEVRWTRPATGGSRRRVHIVQALPGQGMDDAVELMTQAGAGSVRPFVAERSVTRPDAVRARRRFERWNAVAREAAGLAMRADVPRIAAPDSLAGALDALPPRCTLLACTIDGATYLGALDLAGDDVAVVIGPEGGLAPAELALLEARGATAVHLGARVFRSRVAGAVAAVLLLAAEAEAPAPAPAP